MFFFYKKTKNSTIFKTHAHTTHTHTHTHTHTQHQIDFALAEGAPPVGMTTGATIHTSGGLMLKLTKRKHAGASGGGGGETREVVAEAAVVV